MTTTRPSSAAGVEGEDRAAPSLRSVRTRSRPSNGDLSVRRREPRTDARGHAPSPSRPPLDRSHPSPNGDRPRGAPGRGSGDGGEDRPHGLLWGALFTLIPYLVGVLAMLGWSFVQGDLDEYRILLVVTATPYAALATGVAWLLVIGMQYSPARRWRGVTQGLAAAAVVYAIAAAVALVWRL